MNIKSLILLFSLITWATSISAQKRNCGFEEANDWHSSKVEQRLALIEAHIAKQLEQKKSLKTNGVVYQIPVIIHIIHNGEALGVGANISTEQAYSQIDVLNEDFRKLNSDLSNVRDEFEVLAGDAEIEFVLATQDPDGNILSEPGIRRFNGGQSEWGISEFDQEVKPITAYDPYRYVNFWTASLEGDFLGYAQFPQYTTLIDGLGGTGGELDITDGLVMDYLYFGSIDKVVTPQLQAGTPYNKGRTATHEVGHWLGLRHIWGDGGCGASDFVADTPDQGDSYGGCPSSTVTSCSSLDMWENYMDYTNDECMGLFTTGQVARMRTVLESDDMRDEQVNSDVPTIDVPTTPFTVAYFGVDNTTSCTPLTINFSNQSFVALNSATNVTVSWLFEGGSPSSSTSSSVAVRYNDFGTYDVRLIATSSFGTDTLLLEDYITIEEPIGSAGKPLSFIENFETTSFATQGWVVDGGWSFDNVGSNSSNSVYFDNYNINTTGTERSLTSPELNVSSADGLFVSFDLAYTPYYEDSTSFAYDSLAIYYGDGCGSKIKIWQKGGQIMNTVGGNGIPGDYTPSSSHWQRQQFYINSLTDYQLLKLYFTNIGGFGNNIYLDNIRIDLVASLEEDDRLSNSLKIYPNPNKGDFKLNLSSFGTFQEARIKVYNLAGMLIYEENSRFFLEKSIRLPSSEAGLYLVRLEVDGKYTVKKMMIER